MSAKMTMEQDSNSSHVELAGHIHNIAPRQNYLHRLHKTAICMDVEVVAFFQFNWLGI